MADDAVGRVTTLVDSNSATWLTGYDALARIVSMLDRTATGIPLQRFTFAYDPMSNHTTDEYKRCV